MLHSIVQVFDETVRVTRSLEFFLFDYPIWVLFLSSWLILIDSLYASVSVAIPLLYSHVIMCDHLYVILQCYHVILIDFFIPCSGYFHLSVYTWGIFLAYIRRRLSSRLHFHVFWEAGVTMLEMRIFTKLLNS